MNSYVTNKDISDLFFEVAELLEIDDVNRFRVRAYRNAAVSVLNEKEPFAIKVVRGDDLSTLSNIGKDIAEKISEIVRTGELSMLEALEETLPPILVELSHVPGIGAQRVKTIQAFLPNLSQAAIIRAASKNQLLQLPGIGPKIQRAILIHFKKAASV